MHKSSSSIFWAADATARRHSLEVAFAVILATNFCCSIYASIDARGLYHDGVYYLLRIVQNKWFFIPVAARNTVEMLRQIPVVFLANFSDAPLLQLGKAFSFTLLVLPAALCGLCWFIAPRGRKGWLLFPLAYLLVGFAATSTHAVGEAAVAASYFWILLFVFLFRTRTPLSKACFLLLSIPAFQLHEGGILLTAVLLFACATRVQVKRDGHEQTFLVLSIALLVAIMVYQAAWVIHPGFPEDREEFLDALVRFRYFYVDGHVNLPLLTGIGALLALGANSVIYATQPAETAKRLARIVTGLWILLAGVAILLALLFERSFAPLAQVEARYQPISVSAGLGMLLVFLLRIGISEQVWSRPATAWIVIATCAAQAAADVAATHRWHVYVRDLQSRLATARGLVPWETTLSTHDKRADINWHLMAVPWVMPITSVVFAPNGIVRSIIDLPVDMNLAEGERPVDPQKPEQLPILPGVDYGPYREFMAGQRSLVLPGTTRSLFLGACSPLKLLAEQ